jgi:N,N'-diacetyllegionaminate synthase
VTTLIIAEAGVNHNGDLDIARRLVEAAADAGADLVKFQTFAADRLVTQDAAKAGYQSVVTGADETQYAMLRRLELDRAAHEMLIRHCRKHGIGFLSTAFDVESVDLLLELGIERFKIPSGELTNLPYLRHVARQGRPILLSTGMAKLGEIEATLDAMIDAGASRDQITLLHCSTDYPTPMADVNLRAMLTIRSAFGVAVGYSDHTRGIEVAVAAVALGATVIEKHLTLDRALPGPDQQASLEPWEFNAMVAAIRNVESALGDGIKRPTPGESKNIPAARKSLVAARPIRMGETFDSQNVTVKRPGTGVSPMRWDEVMGRRARRDFAADELLEL